LPLHQAALRGDAKSIHRTLQSSRVSINARDEDGQTALHLSVLADDIKFVEGLLAESDVDLNVLDNERSTPLHYAVKNNSTNMVVLLLQHGSRTNIQDTENNVPCDYVHPNAPHMVWMLKHGVSQKWKDIALLKYAKTGDVRAVEVMLSLGARATAKSQGGNQALMYAAMHGNAHITKAICDSDKLSLNNRNDVGQTAIMLAAIHGHLDAATALLDKSPDLELKEKAEGRTALFYALIYAHGSGDENLDPRWAIAAAILKAGANIEAEDKDGLTPLAWFCRLGKFSAVRWLVEMGAAVNGKLGMPRNGFTPLMEAASCRDDVEGACKIIQHLVDNGADLELYDKRTGHTALFEAATPACLPQLKVLISCGAIVNTFSAVRQLPLTIAARRGYHAVAETLLEHGSYVTARDERNRLPINFASQFEHIQCVKLLLKYGSPVSVQNEHLWTPLHEAAERDNYELMVLLLQQPKIQIDLKTDEGETPLLKACKLQNPRCAELLLKRGAYVSAVKNNGWTPLDEASKRGLTQTMTALLAAGAAPNEISAQFLNTHYTPLMLAAHNGRLEACQVLVAHGADVRVQNPNGDTAYYIAKHFPRVQGFLGQCLAGST
jgi:ankyrin repeat protein